MSNLTPFQILDGGIATELERRGHDLNDDLWSARLLLEHPDEIVAVHSDYLAAGADIITSCSYQATVTGFKKIGVDATEAQQLIVDSVKLAQEACREFAAANPESSPKLVAAGVGPFGAALADGSEYSGNYQLGTVWTWIH